MIDNNKWDEIADRISEEDFYRPDHKLIFTQIKVLLEKGTPVDPVTLADGFATEKLEAIGGVAYLGALYNNTPSAANIKSYAEIVRERSVLRQLIEVGTEITDLGFDPQGRHSNELLDYAEKQVYQIAEQQQRYTRSYASVGSILGKVIEQIERLHANDQKYTGLETHFLDFDEITSGLQKSDLVIIAGRPSMGKTSFAMNIAENAAMSGMPVGVFSMEMPAHQLVMRSLSSLGRIDQHKLRTGQLEDDDWPRIASILEMISDKPLYIDDTPALTPGEIRARARRLKREVGLELIILDYLQLMQVPGHRENRTGEISEISRSLKALAREINIPIIALSQLNRSLESRPNKRPVMSDLRECVTGDTLVSLADGRRLPIQALVDQTPAVLAINDQGKLQAAVTEKIWPVGKKKVFDLYLASGRRIRATAKHRLYAKHGWQRLQQLGVGDQVAIAGLGYEPFDMDAWPDDRVTLLAHLVGDGSYVSGQPLPYTTFVKGHSDIVARVAGEQFDVNINRYEQRGPWRLMFSSGKRGHPAGINKWLRELGIFGQRPHEKRIPSNVFRLSNRQITLFLQHLWASIGTIRQSGSGNTIYLQTQSRWLADDVSALLLRLGIVARIQTLIRASVRSAYLVQIGGIEQQRLFLKRVGALDREADEHKALPYQFDSDLYWDRIVAVEPVGEQEVYDLTVPGPASWLADGIVSHNSGAIEQDADLIIFIYRDEVYHEDSQEKGIAEIIIGKHRNGPTGIIKLTFLGQYTRFENYRPDEGYM